MAQAVPDISSPRIEFTLLSRFRPAWELEEAEGNFRPEHSLYAPGSLL